MITCLDDNLIQSIFKKYGRKVSSINFSNNGLRCIRKIEHFASTLEELYLAKNEIVDIIPLSHLTNLRCLDLTENFVSDLRPLSPLESLEALQLTDNSIASLESLRPLGNLRLLRDLSLVGNPVCRVEGYRSFVQALLPNLQYLDDCELPAVDKAVGANSKFLKSLDGSTAENVPQNGHCDPVQNAKRETLTKLEPIVSILVPSAGSRKVLQQSRDPSGENDNQSKLHSASDIFSLEAQVRALESALEAQERTLALAAASAPLSIDRVESTSRDTAHSSSSSFASLAPAPECFPYVQLLQTWRRKVMQSMMATNIAERDFQRAIAQHKKEHSVIRQQTLEAEGALTACKSRLAAVQEKFEKQCVRVEKLEEALRAERVGRTAAESEANEAKLSIRKMKEFLRAFKTAMDENWVRGQVFLVKAMDKVKQHESRLKAAADRIALAAALFAQKEIVIRNSAAALEAERRNLHRSSARVSESPDNESVLEDVATTRLLSDVRIRPECESLLRSVFRALDPDDVGLVSIGLIAESLGVVDSANTDFPVVAESRDSLAVFLKTVLGSSLWDTLVQNLSGTLNSSKDVALTWGEFLLLLVPDPSEFSRQAYSALSCKDFRSMPQDHIWGDEQWSMVPLQLTKSVGSWNVSNIQPEKSVSQEIARLASERSFLLHRLQELIRTLDRRVEAAREYFAADIRQGQNRERRLRIEGDELKTQNALLQSRLAELEQASELSKERSESRLRSMEIENQKLVDEVGLSRNDQRKKFEAEITEERAKFTRLETEHNVLQRELGKKEVRLKGLQREVLRLQSAVAAPREEAIAAKKSVEQLHDDLAKKDHEISHLREQLQTVTEASRRECQELQQRVHVLERAVMLAANDNTGSNDIPAVPIFEVKGTRETAPVDPAISSVDDIESKVLRQLDVLRALSSGSTASERGGHYGIGREIHAVPAAEAQQEPATEGRSLASSESSHGAGIAPPNAGNNNSSNLYAAHLSKLLRYTDELLRS